VPPGRYRVTLSVGGTQLSREFDVQKDSRIQASDADLEELSTFLLGVQKALAGIGHAKRHITALRESLKKSSAPDAPARLAILEQIAARLVTPHYDGYLETLAHPSSLEGRLGTLEGVVNSGYARPSVANYALRDSLIAQVSQQLQALHAFDDLKVHDPVATGSDTPTAHTEREQDRD
jgi:hypothetical protein